MNIQSAYDHWASSYDHDKNLTRDLDAQITREIMSDMRFEHVLELGCGTGKNTAFYHAISKQVHALDFSEGMIEKARQKFADTQIHFDVADLTKPWPCKNNTYDVIACNLVLEHIDGLSLIFEQASRCLRKGGFFYLSEFHPFRQYQGGKARYVSGKESVEIPSYVHHISEFLSVAKNHEFSLQMLNEHWHTDDIGKLPRIVSLMFQK
jgi:ubiquinone/menaquinone biosynthesis C-methylase UbiE